MSGKYIVRMPRLPADLQLKKSSFRAICVTSEAMPFTGAAP